MVPPLASTVLQRGGQGGRDKQIWCQVVMMVEKSKQDSPNGSTEAQRPPAVAKKEEKVDAQAERRLLRPDEPNGPQSEPDEARGAVAAEELEARTIGRRKLLDFVARDAWIVP
ncbi:hypothetical protein FRC12_001259 [Ceratobasidium sp. 428]|nr:hypothetical protein FRC12_001259 [Ceratobasidium sp. 428]